MSIFVFCLVLTFHVAQASLIDLIAEDGLGFLLPLQRCQDYKHALHIWGYMQPCHMPGKHSTN